MQSPIKCNLISTEFHGFVVTLIVLLLIVESLSQNFVTGKYFHLQGVDSKRVE